MGFACGLVIKDRRGQVHKARKRDQVENYKAAPADVVGRLCDKSDGELLEPVDPHDYERGQCGQKDFRNDARVRKEFDPPALCLCEGRRIKAQCQADKFGDQQAGEKGVSRECTSISRNSGLNIVGHGEMHDFDRRTRRKRKPDLAGGSRPRLDPVLISSRIVHFPRKRLRSSSMPPKRRASALLAEAPSISGAGAVDCANAVDANPAKISALPMIQGLHLSVAVAAATVRWNIMNSPF